jgi:hypothetical protein
VFLGGAIVDPISIIACHELISLSLSLKSYLLLSRLQWLEFISCAGGACICVVSVIDLVVHLVVIISSLRLIGVTIVHPGVHLILRLLSCCCFSFSMLILPCSSIHFWNFDQTCRNWNNLIPVSHATSSNSCYFSIFLWLRDLLFLPLQFSSIV